MRTKAGEKRIIDLSADIIEFRGHSCLFATPLGTTESRKLEPIIEELSTPVVQAQEGLLVVPLIGRVDGSRAAQLRNQLLNAVHTNRARAVVIDLTGVPKIESETADGLIRSIEAVQLLGAKVILAGISAIIADTLDRKSTRLNSSHGYISYAVFCLKKKKNINVAPRNEIALRICEDIDCDADGKSVPSTY